MKRPIWTRRRSLIQWLNLSFNSSECTPISRCVTFWSHFSHMGICTKAKLKFQNFFIILEKGFQTFKSGSHQGLTQCWTPAHGHFDFGWPSTNKPMWVQHWGFILELPVFPGTRAPWEAATSCFVFVQHRQQTVLKKCRVCIQLTVHTFGKALSHAKFAVGTSNCCEWSIHSSPPKLSVVCEKVF